MNVVDDGARGAHVTRCVTRRSGRAGRTVVLDGPATADPPVPLPEDAAVLVARPDAERAGPPRVLAAVRELPGDLAVLDEAADVAAELDAELVIAHAVPLSFGEHSVGLDAAVDRGRGMLDVARRRVAHHAPQLRVSTSLTRRWAHELLGEDVDADLVVLGGRGAAELGLVARTAVRHAPCPVLVVPRARPDRGGPERDARLEHLLHDLDVANDVHPARPGPEHGPAGGPRLGG
jgi:nucleotide-binding universal stress UspA family protein